MLVDLLVCKREKTPRISFLHNRFIVQRLINQSFCRRENLWFFLCPAYYDMNEDEPVLVFSLLLFFLILYIQASFFFLLLLLFVQSHELFHQRYHIPG